VRCPPFEIEGNVFVRCPPFEIEGNVFVRCSHFKKREKGNLQISPLVKGDVRTIPPW
jgi:hypothetical protein